MNLEEYHKFYNEVYSQDLNKDLPSKGWIQWKGTDVCIDLECQCGFSGHYDGDFLYYFECPQCHSKYALSQNVALIKLTPEQIEVVKDQFKTAEIEP